MRIERAVPRRCRRWALLHCTRGRTETATCLPIHRSSVIALALAWAAAVGGRLPLLLLLLLCEWLLRQENVGRHC